MKENNIKVFNYVKQNDGKNFTAADIAAALDLDVKSVNGIITSSFCRHREEVDGEKVIVPLMERVEADIETSEGKKTVKFIKITEEGKKFVPEAE